MASAAQIAANRANAQRSTGPRSAEGKARSSKNNLRYGFRSQSVLLPGDDPAEYQQLLDELTAHFGPGDPTGQRYVREMADAEWRLRRVRAYQEAILTAKIKVISVRYPNVDPMLLQARAFEAAHQEASFDHFLTYEAKCERQYERAYQGWMKTQEKRSRHQAREIRAGLEAANAGAVRTDEPNSGPKPATPASPEPAIEAKPAAPAPLPAEMILSGPNAIPRSAPCPCGSGEKYKRCCGRNAPAVLHGADTAPSPVAQMAARG